jgi:hypothetical protein
MSGLAQALGESTPHASSYRELTMRARQEAPPCHAEPLTPEQAQALDGLTDALRKLAAAFGKDASHYANAPLPEPELRVRPPL